VASQHFAYATYGEGFNSNFGPIWQWDPGQYLRRDVKPTTLKNYEMGVKGNAGEGRFCYALAAFFIRQTNRPILLSNPAAFEDFTEPPTSSPPASSTMRISDWLVIEAHRLGQRLPPPREALLTMTTTNSSGLTRAFSKA